MLHCIAMKVLMVAVVRLLIGHAPLSEYKGFPKPATYTNTINKMRRKTTLHQKEAVNFPGQRGTRPNFTQERRQKRGKGPKLYNTQHAFGLSP